MSWQETDEQPGRVRVKSARTVALKTLMRAEEDDAYVDRALRSEAQGLDSREHQLARQLVYAAVQRRSTLAWWIEELTDRRVTDLDPQVRVPLELGLVQLAFLDRIPAHAAVDESVNLAKMISNRGGDRMVNAVLRRVVRNGLPSLPTDETARGAAVVHSVPRWPVATNRPSGRSGSTHSAPTSTTSKRPSACPRTAMPNFPRR
jgi:16S rRNA (cytosine967-C5)-methyltransferase